MRKSINKTKKIILISMASLIVFFLITFSYTLFVIQRSVKAVCAKAKSEYKKDCVESLIQVVQCSCKSFRERNQAIWTLGQLADKKTLPVLQQYYTGKIPQRESLDKGISQYELQKAIKWCEKGNVTSWMYKDLK